MRTLSTIVRTRHGTSLRVPNTLLVVTRGPDAGREYELRGLPVVVGRGRDADLRLSDPTCSRRHLRLEPTGEGWRMRDLGSSGGTLVDGVRVEAAWLAPGQTLGLGDSELRVSAGERDLPAPPHEGNAFEGLVGESPPMRALFGLAAKVAPLDLPVLLRGEPGTGKEGLARALHARSGDPEGPYEVVDCTLLASGDHMRSELFGHVAGAFSGATSARPGAFVRADGGTLFLDEVGELPPDLQPQLLRVLQEGEVRPLGGDEVARVRVRVVSATNRDLAAMVEAGSFRSDLYHRLAALTLEVPPLRSRGDDLERVARSLLPEGSTLTPEAWQRLRAHPWPGNVRELGFVLRAAAALGSGRRIDADELRLAPPLRSGGEPAASGPPDLEAHPGAAHVKSARTRSRERSDEEIVAALAATGGNRAQAARRLGMGRSTFFRRLAALKEAGLDPA